VLLNSDLEALLAIEVLTQTSPWSRAAFERCYEAGYPGWVIEDDGHIVGFIIGSLATITAECHILNLCMHPKSQGKGLGSSLLDCAIEWAKQQGAVMVYLEVRRSNYAAIKLYQKMHFKLIGERKNYYPTAKGYEDALVFARDLSVENLIEDNISFHQIMGGK
jgi:[ribosomal protein S18]-alanine N-acetyltransferase